MNLGLRVLAMSTVLCCCWWILSLFSFTAEAANNLLIGKKYDCCCSVAQFSCIWLFVTPWTVAPQASLSFTISQSLFKLKSIESVMPSNHLILCSPVLPLPSIFPSISVLSLNQLFPSGGQSTRASALATVLPMNILLSQFWELIFLAIRIEPLGCDYNYWSSLQLYPHFGGRRSDEVHQSQSIFSRAASPAVHFHNW